VAIHDLASNGLPSDALLLAFGAQRSWLDAEATCGLDLRVHRLKFIITHGVPHQWSAFGVVFPQLAVAVTEPVHNCDPGVPIGPAHLLKRVVIGTSEAASGRGVFGDRSAR
jgi:hypothetical protein